MYIYSLVISIVIKDLRFEDKGKDLSLEDKDQSVQVFSYPGVPGLSNIALSHMPAVLKHCTIC